MSKISQYGALAAPRTDDELVIVDVHDTTMAASGTTKNITVGNLFPVLIPPSGDATGATDTAAINAAAQAGKAAVLTAGTYYVTHLLPDSLGAIIGQGRATILQAVSGTTGYMIALKTPASTRQVLIRDLTLIPNTGTLGGIQLDNTGFTPSPGGSSPWNPFDPLHTLQNVFVNSAGGDAYHFDNNQRGLSVINCRQYFAGGYGFYLGPGAASSGAGCTDSNFTGCISGTSANHGYFIASGSSNNMFASCKAFWAGYTQSTATWSTTQCGFEIQGSTNSFTACDAQQNALHGFDLQAATDCAVTGCHADTNSAGNGVTTGVGINTNAAIRCAIGMNSGSNNGGLSPGSQKFGIQVAGTQTGTTFYGNTVTGNSADFNYVSGFGYQLISASQIGMWQATLFQSPALILATNGTPQALSNGSTITPTVTTNTNYGVYPVSSTGNVTGIIIAAAPNGTGSQITILNTANFTITFAASGTSNVADGTSDVIPALCARTYIYNGSLWYRSA